uniref:Uncharacterized protein n=1 Tax=Oryza rufipogon TaxID=4529 RepID=A0A0E0Q263_ORYRU
MGAKSEREMERARNTQEDEICNAKSEREMKHVMMLVRETGLLFTYHDGKWGCVHACANKDDDDPNYHGTDFVGVGEGEDERNEYTDEGNNVDEEEDEAATDVARKREM